MVNGKPAIWSIWENLQICKSTYFTFNACIPSHPVSSIFESTYYVAHFSAKNAFTALLLYIGR